MTRHTPIGERIFGSVNHARLSIRRLILQHFKATQRRLFDFISSTGFAIKDLILQLHQKSHAEVGTPAQVQRMLESPAKVPKDGPNIGFNLESDDLGRNGKTCYLQRRDFWQHQTYLVDLLVLGQLIFTVGSKDGLTLKSFLEDPSVQKLIFDCRQDSKALFADFGIVLAKIADIQYMVMLSPQSRRTGLPASIRQYADLDEYERRKWVEYKGYCFGGGYSIFIREAMSARLEDVCS